MIAKMLATVWRWLINDTLGRRAHSIFKVAATMHNIFYQRSPLCLKDLAQSASVDHSVVHYSHHQPGPPLSVEQQLSSVDALFSLRTRQLRSTQLCIPPGSLNRIPACWGKGGNVASAGWQVRLRVIPYGMWVPVVVWRLCELPCRC